MTNHATAPIIAAAPTRPPITPPAIAPAFELLCGVEEAVDDEAADVRVAGVKVDWETLTADVGTMRAVPVTSGESRPGVGVNTCGIQRSRVSHLLWHSPLKCSSRH